MADRLDPPAGDATSFATPGALARYCDPRIIATPALDILDEVLVDAANGGCDRVIFTMPPQEGKSERVSRAFVLWMLRRNPELRVAVVSYADRLARRASRNVRNDILRHPDLGLRLEFGSTAAEAWRVADHDGGMIARGINAGISGEPVDILIIDDPFADRKEAESQVMRDNVWDWWTDSGSARLAPGAIVIVIMCMTGDTPVLMSDGTERPLRDVRPGDVIATYENGRLTTSKVLNWANQGPDSIYEIRMSSGVSVRANARHPFLTTKNGVEAWVQTDALKAGDLILTATGGNGAGLPARSMSVNSPRSARACACRTTLRLAGPQDIGPHRSILSLGETPGSNIGTASPAMNMIDSSQSAPDCVMSAASFRAARTREPIGAGSSVLTMTTELEQCGACSAMTAILPLATDALPNDFAPPLSTWSVASSEVIEIVSAGREDVFDLQVERTENFIANGLVSHNTRWHEDDLAGRLMKDQPDVWRHVNIPAQAEHDPALGAECKCGQAADGSSCCLGRDILRRKPGQFMISARGRTTEQWEMRKRTAGSRGWTALFQGRPAPSDGDIFHRRDFRFYTSPRALLQPNGSWLAIGADQVAISCDFAFKDTKTSDYVAIQVWARRGPKAWLLDQVHDRLSFSASCEALRTLVAKWPQATRKLVEDKANGTAIIDTLRKDFTGIIAVTPTESKIARAEAVVPLLEAGDVEFPHPLELSAPWVAGVVDEACAFPNAAHDDRVDGMTQMLRYWYIGPTGARARVLNPNVSRPPR